MDNETTKRDKKPKASSRRKAPSRGKEDVNKKGKSNSEFRKLFDSINQGMAIHEIIYNSSGKAIDYKLTDINPIYELIAGVSKKDVIGKTPGEIYNLKKAPYLEVYAGVASLGKSVSFETYFKPKDIYLQIFVFSTKAGTFTTIFSDITAQKKSEESLKNAYQKTSDILGSIQTDFYVLDSNWNFIFASKTFTSRIGKEPKDFIGRNIWKIFPKHIGTEYEANLRAAMEKKEMRRFEVGGRYTDAYYEMVVFPSEDGITVLGSDVTQLKQTEQNVKQNENKYRSLFENMGEAAVLTEAVFDAQGKPSDYIIIESNKAWNKLYRRSGEEASGKTVLGLLPNISRHWLDNAAIVATTGVNRHVEYFSHIFSKWLEVDFYSPKAGQVAAISSDITGRKKTEGALKESEERFRTMADTMPQLVWTANSDGIVDYFNARSVEYRVTTTSLTDHDWTPALHPDDVAPTLKAWREAVARGVIYQKEQRLRVSDGSYRWHLARAIPQRDKNGVIIKWFGTTTDIHDLKLVEELLKESEMRFRLVMRHAPVSVAIQDLDLKYTWAFNQKTAQPEGIIGLYDREIFTPEEAAQVTEMKKRVIKEDTDLSLQRWFDRPSGRIFLAVYWEPIHDTSARVIGVGSTTVDITQLKNVEKALQETVSKLKGVTESMNEAVFISDLDGNFIDFNEAFATFHRFKNKAECYKKLSQYTDYIDVYFSDGTLAPLDMWAVPRALRGESLSNVEYILRRKDTGEKWWASFSFGPMRDNNGKVVGSVVVGRDITESKKAEKELKEREERFRVLIENLRSGVALINESGQFSVYNSSFLRLFGLAKDSDIMNVNNQNWNDWKVYEEDGKTLLNVDEHPVRKAAMTGKPVRNKLVGVRLPSGEDLIWMVINAEPIISLDGTLQYIIVTYYDITERKNAEEQLRNRAEELETVMNLVPVAIWVAHDPACHNITGNQKANEFYEAEEGENVSAGPASGEPVPPRRFFRNGKELTAEELPMQESAAQNQAIQGSEFNVILPSGKSRTLWGSASPLRNDDGQVRGVVAAFLDITERKQAEEGLKHYTVELESTNKELESYSYSISHDLRAPLRTLDGFSEMVIEEYGDKLDETGKEYLNRIRKAGQTMSQLTEDILKLSRITRAEMHRDEVNLTEMAGTIAGELQRAQPERIAEIIIAPDMIVNGDKALLEILLRNLLDNAWKYTGKCSNARIEMGVNRQDGKSVYFIRDNGVGFDIQYKNKLFQPFQRLHSSKDYPGTGIGLATAQRVVRRHGGDIWVESELNKGTTFYFTLE